MPTGRLGDAWDQYARDLGLRLQRLRHAREMTQESLAAAAGISPYTYRKLEKGESNPGSPANPRLKTLVALAEVLGVRMVDIVPPDAPSVAVGR